MKPVEIDFSGRSHLFTLNLRRREGLLWVAVLVIAVITLAIGGAVAWHLNRQTRQLADAADLIAQAEQAREQSLAQSTALSGETLDIINAAVDQLNYPWDVLFRVLEKHARPGIGLLSLETGPLRQGTRMIFEADHVDEALRYLADIKKETLFARAALVKQETASNEAGPTLRFTIEVPGSMSVLQAPGRSGT